MQLTFYGHACFEVNWNGTRILFDPFITPNEKASHIDINTIKPDYILLSHGHADHIADAVQIAKNSGATVVSNYEIITWLGAQGVEKGHPMNHGGKWKLPFGTVKYVNAVHSSSFPDGSYAGNPGGFILDNGKECFYYAGDTALTYDMKMFGEMHNLDFAILPIGDNFTMGVDDALIASKWLNCDKIVGVHYDTFGYIVIDHEEAVQKFAGASKKLLLPGIGESVEL